MWESLAHSFPSINACDLSSSFFYLHFAHLLNSSFFNPQESQFCLLSHLLLLSFSWHSYLSSFPHFYFLFSPSPSSVVPLLFFFLIFIYLFIYLWLCWVFVSVRGLSPVAASGGHSSSRCAGLSLSRPLLLQSTGSRRAGSAIVAHGPSRSTACGILPDQGPNPCPLHWQADSQPLRHQGSPVVPLLNPWFLFSCLCQLFES